MAVKNPQFEINVRKNTNSNNPGYGKYYPKAKEKQTISLRGLCNHMAGHNCIYGRDIIEGVLTKMSSCITELLSQGNPVKIDYPDAEIMGHCELEGVHKACPSFCHVKPPLDFVVAFDHLGSLVFNYLCFFKKVFKYFGGKRNIAYLCSRINRKS